MKNLFYTSPKYLQSLKGIKSSASEIDGVVSDIFLISSLQILNNNTIREAIESNNKVLFDVSVQIDDTIVLTQLSNKIIIMNKDVEIFIDRHGYAGLILDRCSNITLEYPTLRGHGNFPDKLNPNGTPLIAPQRGMGEKGAYPNYSNFRNGNIASGGIVYGNGLMGTRGDGIVLAGCSDVTIYGAHISWFNGAGIQEGDNTTSYNSQTHNKNTKIAQSNIYNCYTAGIFSNFSKNLKITNNHVENIGHPDADDTDDVANPGYGYGVGTWGTGSSPSSDIVISNNTSNNVKRKALDFHGGERITVIGNVCSNSMNAGASLAGAVAGYPRDITLLGNTFINCGSTDFPTEVGYGIQANNECIASSNTIINASTPFYMNGKNIGFNNNKVKYSADYVAKTVNKSALVIRNAKNCSFSGNTISMKGSSTTNTYMIEQFSTSIEKQTTLVALGNTYEKGDAVGDNNIISNNDSVGIGKITLGDIILSEDIRVENSGVKKLRNNIFETKATITILASGGGLTFTTDAKQGTGSIANITNTNPIAIYITLKNSDTARIDYYIDNYTTSDTLISRVDIFKQNSSILGVRIINNSGVVLNTTSLSNDIVISLTVHHDRFYI